MKFFPVLFFISLFWINGNAQSVKPEYYFVTENDTVYCNNIKFGLNWLSNLNYLKYTDLYDNVVELQGTDQVPNVKTFYMNGVILDNIPLNADRPGGRKIFTERIVDGKIKLYYSKEGTSIPLGGGKTYTFTTTQERFFVKMPDETIHDLRKRISRQNVLNPFMDRCYDYIYSIQSEITNEMENIKHRVRVYNRVCD